MWKKLKVVVLIVSRSAKILHFLKQLLQIPLETYRLKILYAFMSKETFCRDNFSCYFLDKTLRIPSLRLPNNAQTYHSDVDPDPTLHSDA